MANPSKMPTKQFYVADPDGPVVGQTKFKAKFLGKVFVDYLIVNHAIENQLNPNPSFTHSYVQREIDRAPNTWAPGDKLIIVYTRSRKHK